MTSTTTHSSDAEVWRAQAEQHRQSAEQWRFSTIFAVMCAAIGLAGWAIASEQISRANQRALHFAELAESCADVAEQTLDAARELSDACRPLVMPGLSAGPPTIEPCLDCAPVQRWPVPLRQTLP